jgi:hypothetical protein
MTPHDNKPLRHEIKFVAPGLMYHQILHWLRVHPTAFLVAHPSRRVNNIYFDTSQYDAYRDNLVGMSARAKVRFRWYGESETPSPGQLEVKCKRSRVGWKWDYPIAQAPYAKPGSWETIKQLLLDQLPNEGKRWLYEFSQPVLLNRYTRDYLISFDKKIRATVDYRQVVYDQRYKPSPNFLHKANLPETVVLEIKFSQEHASLASEVIAHIPLRVSRHSKYVVGVKAIHGF